MPGGTVRTWNDDMHCNFLTLADPKVDLRSGVIQVMSAATAQVGTTIGKRCLVLLDWAGFVEVFEELVLGVQPGVVEFRVVNSNVYALDDERAGDNTLARQRCSNYFSASLIRNAVSVS